jgi:hypothetical protein
LNSTVNRELVMRVLLLLLSIPRATYDPRVDQQGFYVDVGVERWLSGDFDRLRILDNSGSLDSCSIASYHPHSVCSSSSSVEDAA